MMSLAGKWIPAKTTKGQTVQLIGYVRVSRVGGREGESFISPDVQRERIAAYATAHGHEVLEYVTDLDASGGTMSRPGFSRALAAIEAGQAQGLIVAKLDRFARTLPGALECVQRLGDAGAVLVSVADNIDASTPTGELMLHLLLTLAHWQRSMIAAEWRSSTAKAVERGVHIAAHTPLGYCRDESGRLVIDESKAELVRSVFAARAAGAGMTEAGRCAGLSRQAAAHVISNRCYLGEARHGDVTNPDAHPALVDRETFEAAQLAPTRADGERARMLLSGLVRCAECRGAMSGHRKAGAYRCGNPLCSARAGIKSDTVEQLVRSAYAERVTGPAHAAAIFGESAELLAELEQAEAELRAFVAVMRASEPGFREGYDGRRAVVDEARRAVAGIAQPEVVSVDPAAPIDEQRARFARAIAAVFVRKGAGADRCRIVWQGEPLELPSRGNRSRRPGPYVF